MGRRKFPWHTDIDLLRSRGANLKAAQTATILTWMERGDLLPLADVITDGQPLDRTILHCLASMIFKGTLVVKRRRHRGHPRVLSKADRDQKVAQRYEELAKTLPSTEAFQKAGHEFRGN
jgi:hypothetical protein